MSDLAVLPLKKIYMYKIGLIMFKVFHKISPSVFTTLFTLNHAIHNYHTRQCLHFHVPIVRTEYMKKVISYNGVKIWNRFCDKFNLNCSFLSFKSALKKYLLSELES